MPRLHELPPECVLLVADQITQPRDINALARTSQHMHATLNRYMYRRAVQYPEAPEMLQQCVEKANIEGIRHWIAAGGAVEGPNDRPSVLSAVKKRHAVLSSLYQLRYIQRIKSQPLKPGVHSRNEAIRLGLEAKAQTYLEIAELLIDNGAPLVPPVGWCWTLLADYLSPLHLAAHTWDKDMILALLKKGADVHCTVEGGLTVLHAAVNGSLAISPYYRGDIGPIVECLVEHGADVNARLTKSGITPLHDAVCFLEPTAAAALLVHGARPNIADVTGNTPLHYVKYAPWGKPIDPLVKLLLGHGADMEAKTNGGWTPLATAVVFAGDEAPARCLIQNGADVDFRDMDGRDPVQLAHRYHGPDFARKIRDLLEEAKRGTRPCKKRRI
ncbi:ankyrin repeat-containing domain protein [Aspergillus heterothallicus]